MPIFNRFATRNSIRSAKLERETQQLQLDNVRKNLYKEIQQAYYNTIAARAKYEKAAWRPAAATRQPSNLMSAKYEYGKANITEFNEAKNNWLKAESDLVIAKYEYVYDTSLIDFYRGKELDFWKLIPNIPLWPSSNQTKTVCTARPKHQYLCKS